MATRRLSILLAGAMTVGIGAAWVVSDFRPVPPARQSCRVGVPYEVDVLEEQATFDLPFEANTRYRLIFGSVTDHQTESSITLSAERIPSVERFPLREAPAIQSAIPEPFRTTWKQTAPSESQRRPTKTINPSQRIFHLHVTDGPLNDPRQYAKVIGRRIAEGRYVRIFLDSNMQKGQLASGLVPEIVRLFDDQIVPGSRRVLGTFRDVDGDGKFAILISPWLSKLQGGKTALGGFVRGSDFQSSVKPPFGNGADIMYLSANLRPGPHLHTLLAHEFAHAICFSERLPTKLHPQGLPTEEDWLNEAIAHVSENLHETGWSNLDHRISRFLDETHRSPLVVPNYYADGLWRDPGCRGATYLFLRWVIDQFGPEVLSRLIHNPNRGIPNLESATGVAFPDLFRGWTIALSQELHSKDRDPSARPLQFTSLNLQQRVGRWGLQGIRTTEWNLIKAERKFSLSGTTAKVFEVHTTKPGVYRLRIRTQGQPNLQVTVIRQSEDRPQWQASAKWQTLESGRQQSRPALDMQIASSQESAIKIVRASVECRQGKHHQSVCFETGHISVRQIPSDTGSLQTVSVELPSRLWPRQRSNAAKWQLKILLEDSHGQRSATWINLPLPPKPTKRQPIPLAARPSPKSL